MRGTEYRVKIDPSSGESTVPAVTDTVSVDANGATVNVPPGFETVIPTDQAPSAIQPIIPAPSGIRIDVQGPARPFLTDSRHRGVGFQPDVDAYGSQIPGAAYTVGGAGQSLTIPDPESSYDLVLSAVANGGPYSLTVTSLAGAQPTAYRGPGLAQTLGAQQLAGALSSGQHSKRASTS